MSRNRTDRLVCRRELPAIVNPRRLGGGIAHHEGDLMYKEAEMFLSACNPMVKWCEGFKSYRATDEQWNGNGNREGDKSGVASLRQLNSRISRHSYRRSGERREELLS